MGFTAGSGPTMSTSISSATVAVPLSWKLISGTGAGAGVDAGGDAGVGVGIGEGEVAETIGWDAGTTSGVGVGAGPATAGEAGSVPATMNLRSPERLLASLSIRLPRP